MKMEPKIEPLCRIRDIYRSINDFEIKFHAKYGVKLNEGMLICTLSRQEKCSSGQIAELMGLSSSNCSKVISSAEKKGLIERIIGNEDKRQMFFRLTDKGKSYIGKIHCQAEQIDELIEEIRKI